MNDTDRGDGAGAAASLVDDLITIIDFCDAMATSIRDDWSDPRTECRAIWDAQDLAHVLTGAERGRNWTYMRAMLMEDLEEGSPVSTDLRHRMLDLINRTGGQLPAGTRGADLIGLSADAGSAPVRYSDQ